MTNCDCRREEAMRERDDFKVISSVIRALVVVFLLACLAIPANAADLAKAFGVYDPKSTRVVDHLKWNQTLAAYLYKGEDGLNRFDYAGLKAKGLARLATYLERLQKADPTKLTRDEQFAFWVNLYNATTVDIVARQYPVNSIRDIRQGDLFSSGPWTAKLVKVNGQSLSLDDIEHKILRPIWRDPRIHYAVNCASVGCPNLASTAYTGGALAAMLDKAARDYVNSPRGVRFDGSRLVVSSIYDWYEEDFGGSKAGVLEHLGKYASPPLSRRISQTGGISGYDYDWALNDKK
jgi:hypothetical protein